MKAIFISLMSTAIFADHMESHKKFEILHKLYDAREAIGESGASDCQTKIDSLMSLLSPEFQLCAFDSDAIYLSDDEPHQCFSQDPFKSWLQSDCGSYKDVSYSIDITHSKDDNSYFSLTFDVELKEQETGCIITNHQKHYLYYSNNGLLNKWDMKVISSNADCPQTGYVDKDKDKHKDEYKPYPFSESPYETTKYDECPEEKPSELDSCSFEGLTCDYGEWSCCGETIPTSQCVCDQGRFNCPQCACDGDFRPTPPIHFNDDRDIETTLPAPITIDPPIYEDCPVQQPSPSDECSFEGRCVYNEHTCCGETYPIEWCECYDGKALCVAASVLPCQCDDNNIIPIPPNPNPNPNPNPYQQELVNEYAEKNDYETGLAPIAADDYVVTTKNKGVSVDVLANDRDPDQDEVPENALYIKEYTSGSKGTVISRGKILRYIPHKDECGDDIFTYTIADNDDGLTASAKVYITIDCPYVEEGKEKEDYVIDPDPVYEGYAAFPNLRKYENVKINVQIYGSLDYEYMKVTNSKEIDYIKADLVALKDQITDDAAMKISLTTAWYITLTGGGIRYRCLLQLEGGMPEPQLLEDLDGSTIQLGPPLAQTYIEYDVIMVTDNDYSVVDTKQGQKLASMTRMLKKTREDKLKLFYDVAFECRLKQNAGDEVLLDKFMGYLSDSGKFCVNKGSDEQDEVCYNRDKIRDMMGETYKDDNESIDYDIEILYNDGDRIESKCTSRKTKSDGCIIIKEEYDSCLFNLDGSINEFKIMRSNKRKECDETAASFNFRW